MSTSRGLVVVVVDDDDSHRALLTDVLRQEGYDVRCVSDPETALMLDHVPRPSLFVLDLVLPEISGMDLARRLQRGALAEVPKIATSGSWAMLKNARESGLFAETLPKPFDLDDLIDAVRHHCASRV